MGKRVESPSSINTFKQCPRKYFYQYIEKLPTFPTIHTVRGNIVHSVLEDFYTVDVSSFTQEDYPVRFKVEIQKLLLRQWSASREELQRLHLTSDELRMYFEETMLMVLNWCDHFVRDLAKELPKHSSLSDAFQAITPLREKEFVSERHSLRGFVDAIHFVGDEVHILDYKTSSSTDIKESMRLQLALYCLLYKEQHGVLPNKVGIFFLRDTVRMMKVDPFAMEQAEREIAELHHHTSSTDKKADYHKNITALCKWKTGQCDFYDICKPYSG